MRNLTATLAVCVLSAVTAAAALALPGPLPSPPHHTSTSAAPPATATSAARPTRAADGGPLATVLGSPAPSGAQPPGNGATLGPTTAAPPAQIIIADFGFSALTTLPGATVTVVNNDGVAHSVTDPDGLFDTGIIPAGERRTFIAPEAPGAYPFLCSVHPSMTGTLTVT